MSTIIVSSNFATFLSQITYLVSIISGWPDAWRKSHTVRIKNCPKNCQGSFESSYCPKNCRGSFESSNCPKSRWNIEQWGPKNCHRRFESSYCPKSRRNIEQWGPKNCHRRFEKVALTDINRPNQVTLVSFKYKIGWLWFCWLREWIWKNAKNAKIETIFQSQKRGNYFQLGKGWFKLKLCGESDTTCNRSQFHFCREIIKIPISGLLQSTAILQQPAPA